MEVKNADQAEIGTDNNEINDSEPNEEDLSRDDIFHLLQCRRRRLVLKYLREYDGDGPAIMSDITEHIAALENDTTVRSLTSQQRQRVYIALYQSHLPKMDHAGIIDYNQNRGYVECTDLTDDFHPYLDGEPSILPDTESQTESESQASQTEEEPAQPRKRPVVATLSAIAASVLGLGGPVLGSIFGTGLALMTTVLFGALTAVYVHSRSTGD